MNVDYPLLNLMLSSCWMAAFIGIFLAFGWCNPQDYQRKLGVDIFSGIMTIVAFHSVSHIKDVVYASVTPQTDGKLINLTSLMEFVTGYYEQTGFNKIFDVVENQLLALIFIGIALMATVIISIISVVFSIYFVFRLAVLLDLYINNIIRFSIMCITMIIVLIYGLNTHSTTLMTLTLIAGLISIIKLSIGHLRLLYADEKQKTNKKSESLFNSSNHQDISSNNPTRNRPARTPKSYNTLESVSFNTKSPVQQQKVNPNNYTHKSSNIPTQYHDIFSSSDSYKHQQNQNSSNLDKYSHLDNHNSQK